MKKNKNNRNKKLVKNVILGSCLLGRFTGGAVSLQASAPGPIWPQGASGIVSLYDGLLYTLIMQRARRMRGVDQGAFIVEARRLIGRGANLDRVRALLGRADEDPITRENMQGLLGEIDAAIPRVAPPPPPPPPSRAAPQPFGFEGPEFGFGRPGRPAGNEGGPPRFAPPPQPPPPMATFPGQPAGLGRVHANNDRANNELGNLILERAAGIRRESGDTFDQNAFINRVQGLIGRGANLETVRDFLGGGDQETQAIINRLLGIIDAAITPGRVIEVEGGPPRFAPPPQPPPPSRAAPQSFGSGRPGRPAGNEGGPPRFAPPPQPPPTAQNVEGIEATRGLLRLMINYTRILPVNITGPEFEDFVNTALQYVRQEANLDGIEKWVRDGHPEDLTQERRNAMLRLLVVFEDRLLTEAGYSREEAQVMFPRFREGEDVNTRDVDGQTAFFVAVVEGNENMVATFLRNPDVNPNIPNNNGVMPLHVAVEFGYTNIAIQLIQNRRINVNAQNGDGNTALHLAVMGRNAQIVQALLGHPRIDREVQNAAGLTAADEAAEREFYEILELLFQ